MDQNAYIQAQLISAINVVKQALATPTFMNTLQQVANLCIEALKKQHKIILIGNGGSAADAQHIAAELVGRFAYDRAALPAMALTTDTSILTAVGNDYGYEQIFSRQIEGVGCAGDVLIAYSTSGHSKNILNAVTTAQAKNIACAGLTGANSSPLYSVCDYTLQVPSTEVARIQEVHLKIGHILCGLIEQTLFPQSS